MRPLPKSYYATGGVLKSSCAQDVRKRGRRSAAWVAILLATAPAPPAVAGPSAGEREAARLDKVGKNAFRNGAYDDAVIAFKTAWEKAPTPGRLYNLGKAHQRAGNLEGAIKTYERYLEEAPDARDRDQVEEGVDFLRVKLERTKVPLEITTYPEGATIGLECGATRVGGETPWSGWLAPGPCRLIIEQKGYQTVKQDVVLVLEEPHDLQVVLRPPEKKPKPKPKPKPADVPPPKVEPPPLFPVEVRAAFGAAAAALAAGGVLLAVSQSKLSDYDEWRLGTREHSRAEVEEVGQSARTLGIASVVVAGVGVAAAATGGALLYLRDDGAAVTVRRTW